MDDNLSGLITRRSFLRKGACASLGMAGLASQMLTMRMAQAAIATASSVPNDYRAAVCIFLFGGNDNGNTLIPFDGHPQDFAFYQNQRQELALTPQQVAGSIINPVNTGGRRFAMHPAMSDVANLFEQGHVSAVTGVGTLVEPTTKQQFQSRSVQLPNQLFAHNLQQEQWQVSTADAVERIGWGGRVADMLQAAGVNDTAQVSMNMSMAGTSFFLSGREVQPYTISTGGVERLQLNGLGSLGELELIAAAHADLIAIQQNESFAARDAMRKAYADISSRAIFSADLVDAALRRPSSLQTPVPQTSLASQLSVVARLIEQGQAGLGLNRQIFFVAIGGFDNHDGLIGTDATNGFHANRLAEINGGLRYFWDALGDIGMRDNVVTFTASDFGRTYRSNGDGSDHGWAGDHLIMGGAPLLGRRVAGSYPDIQIGGPDDTGNGRFIPTTSVDAYSFEIARWLGVPPSEMSTVFPNLSRFLDINNPATHLGLLLP